VSATGSTFKSCGCRDPQTGKTLRTKCPKLRRADGRWNTAHGSWHYQLELPPRPDGRRRGPLRRAGFTDQDAAGTELNQAKELLAIAGDDQAARTEIADLIVATIKATKQLPVPEEVRRKVRTGQDLDTTVTAGEYLQTWLAGRKKLRPGSLRSYQGHIRLYLTPHLGDIPLDRLRVADVDAVFDAIDESNELITHARASADPDLRAMVKGRRVVGAATKQRIRATLRSALNKAIKERKIDINVAALVELSSGKAPKALVWTQARIAEWRRSHAAYVEEMEKRKKRLSEREPHKRHGTRITRLDAYIGAPRPSRVMVWTPELTALFLRRAKLHRLYAMYYLITFRGLRRGEACGLRWSDVDLQQGVATVRWQITQLGGGTDQGKPKSEAGEGQVTLDTQTIKVLRAHRMRQNTERLAAGMAWVESGFVFTTEMGEALYPAYVTGQFEQLCMEAALPPIRLHDLRHGAASILLAAGYGMKVVQETLRLSSITVAADTYTSLLPDLARQSAEDAAAVIWDADQALHKHQPLSDPARERQCSDIVTVLPTPLTAQHGGQGDPDGTGECAS
jgi:integrase